MADGAGEDEEMEDGVHEAALAETVKQGTGDVADAFGYYPYHGGRTDAMEKRTESHEHAQSHHHVADCLYVAMALESHKALHGSGYCRHPDEDEEHPAPIAILAQRHKRDRRIRSGYVPIYGGVVPLAQPLLPGRPCRKGVIDSRSDVARQHSEEIKDDACRRPAVPSPTAPYEERRADNESEDYARAVRPRVPYLFFMIKVDFHTL